MSRPKRPPCLRPAPRMHMARGQQHLGLRPSCGRWTCKGCAAWLRRRWCGRLRLALEGPGAPPSLHWWEGMTEEWARLRLAAWRAGARSVRVCRADGSLAILFTAALPGSKPVEPGAALDWFAAALRSVRPERPVSCSRGWLPEVADDDTGWRYLGNIDATDEHFEGSLVTENAAGTLTGEILIPKVAAAWTPAEGLSDEEQARLHDRLFRRRPGNDEAGQPGDGAQQ